MSIETPSHSSSHRWLQHLIVTLVVLLVLLLISLLPPIAQPNWYHDFADQRPFFGMAHFSNVISNLGFMIVAILGLWRLNPRHIYLQHPWEYRLWRTFFATIALVALGSSYYHQAPTNDSLLWDRLPIALAFALLLVITLTERISTRLLWPGVLLLLPYAVLSVLYWWWSEHLGSGDLRPYLLLQILTLILLPLLYLLYPGRYGRHWGIFLTVFLYLAAVVSEWHDEMIYTMTDGWLSGHTVKHFLIALSIASLLLMLGARKAR